LKKSRFQSGVFHEEDKENFPMEKSRPENRNDKKSFHEQPDKENSSVEKTRSLLLVPVAGNRIMMTSSASNIGPRSGLISSSEIAKQTPTKLPLKRTNVFEKVVLNNKPLRGILKPSLTKRRINHQQRIQLLSSFYFK